MRCAVSGGEPGEGGRFMQVLFCEPSLGKVGRDSRDDVKKALLYYDTNFFVLFSPAPSMVAEQCLSVR
jgi:hypothetical protein